MAVVLPKSLVKSMNLWESTAVVRDANDQDLTVKVLAKNTAELSLAVTHNRPQTAQNLLQLADHLGLEEVADSELTAQNGWQIAGVVPGVARDKSTPPKPVTSMDDLRRGKLSAIDHKTSTILSRGFQIEPGKYLSLSDHAQLKWLGMYVSRESLVYPVVVPSLDDLSTYEVVDSAHLAQCYEGMVAYLQTVLAEGVHLKSLVASMTTRTEIASFVDNR